MSTNNVPTAPLNRREMWLQIALAVARDGLPDPKDVSFYADAPGDAPFSDGLPYGCVTLTADTAAQAARWAEWAGIGSRQVGTGNALATHFSGARARGGWFWNMSGAGLVQADDAVTAIETALATEAATA